VLISIVALEPSVILLSMLMFNSGTGRIGFSLLFTVKDIVLFVAWNLSVCFNITVAV